MPKVSRSVLKSLVKECLVEILFEGLDDDQGVLEEKKSRKTRSKTQSRRKEEQEFQKAALERKKMLRERTKPRDHSQQLAKTITDDPIMAEIFAQTAETTLPGMINADKKNAYPVASDGAARMVQENDLEDLFEGAGNWAHLAFTSKTNP